MSPRPPSGRRPYPGGQFGDPGFIPDPAKTATAAKATKAGPPPGFPAPGPVPASGPAVVPPPGQPPAPTKKPAPAPPAPTRMSLPTPSLDSSEGGGFLLGLLLYILGLNYLRYGPQGIPAWFKAKFFNETSLPGDPQIYKELGLG